MKHQKKMFASEGDEAAPTSKKSQAIITNNTRQKKEATSQNEGASKTWSDVEA